MKNDMAKRAERAKLQDAKYREMPDIVVRVVCKYRAELYFKISRKTKLSRLFNAWTERMELVGKRGDGVQNTTSPSPLASSSTGMVKTNAASPSATSATPTSSTMQFIFTHSGRTLDADQTPEEAGMEDGDIILAVEMMDLTEGPGTEELVSLLLLDSCSSMLRYLHIGRYSRASPPAFEERMGGESTRVSTVIRHICYLSDLLA